MDRAIAEIGAGLRHLNDPFERALENLQDVVANIHREHWRTKILTVVGGPAHKIAYITGAYWDSIRVLKATWEAGERVVWVQSDMYQDQSVWEARAPGIGDLIERGRPGYPGRFQAQLAIESAQEDVTAQIQQHIQLAIFMVQQG